MDSEGGDTGSKSVDGKVWSEFMVKFMLMEGDGVIILDWMAICRFQISWMPFLRKESVL